MIKQFKIRTTAKSSNGAGYFVGYNRLRGCFELERGQNPFFPHIGGDPMSFDCEAKARETMKQLGGASWGWFEVCEIQAGVVA